MPNSRSAVASLVLASLACGGVSGEEPLYDPWAPDSDARPRAFLEFPPNVSSAPSELGSGADLAGFPRWLSQTGAFRDLATLEPASGLMPYEILAPLWSDGAYKRRWLALPEGGAIHFAEDGPWSFPEGTVLVKHFEMALDERHPEQRRRLETRLWIAKDAEQQYGVSYKWNEAQTDAELLVESQTETLSIVDESGAVRMQRYDYPGPNDCFSCHNQRAGFVIGVRTRQLNRDVKYRDELPALPQLETWASQDYFDTPVGTPDSELYPRLFALDDEAASPIDRVRSYWDGNCSMCHAGADGRIPGWDARFATPLTEQGLSAAPQRSSIPAAALIAPGLPEESLIFVRANSVEPGIAMPPIGRNRVDPRYVQLLTEWIASLEASDLQGGGSGTPASGGGNGSL